MIASVAVVVALLGLSSGAAFSLLDLRTVLLQSSIVAIVALGAMLVISMGGLDLSVGSTLALCTVVAAKVMLASCDQGEPLAWAAPAAALAAIACGCCCGLVNGLLITGLGLPPFIATLGTLGFFRGLAKYLSNSSPVYAKAGWLKAWVAVEPSPSWLLMAPCAWVSLLLACGASLFMHRVVTGRYALAIGDHEEAAGRCGVPVVRTKLLVYMLAGLLAGVAAVVQFARLNGSGDPTIQVGLELKAIAAVVIGGASLSGGSFSVIGALGGAVLMSLLDNRCAAMGLPGYVQEMIVGPIIIVAVAADRWRASHAS
jgi:ribose transport system permease protein